MCDSFGSWGGASKRTGVKRAKTTKTNALSPPRSLASGIREMHPVWVCPVIPGEVFVFLCGSSEGGEGTGTCRRRKGAPRSPVDHGHHMYV